MHRVCIGVAVLVVLAACGGSQRPPAGDPAADADGHVAATAATTRANAAVAAALPLAETAAFDDARRGFVATDDPLRVEDAAGRVVWDRPAYDFVTGPAPASVNPSQSHPGRIGTRAAEEPRSAARHALAGAPQDFQ
jgi:alkyl sulfatase BDS1-like metallo-beta-lactamase superfamily hydrolase